MKEMGEDGKRRQTPEQQEGPTNELEIKRMLNLDKYLVQVVFVGKYQSQSLERVEKFLVTESSI